MVTLCFRGADPASRTSRLFSARELAHNGLLAPNTTGTERIRRFVQSHATEPIAEMAKGLEAREGRIYEEAEGRKVLSLDAALRLGRACPSGQRMRLLNKLALALDLPEVYPGLKDLDESVV